MQNKNHKLPKTIILTTIAIILLLLLIFSEDIIKLQNKNKLNVAQTEDNTSFTTEPNIPRLSAGMIPVKLDGENWIITTKNDTDWYDYSQGKPAYIMLNDGTYQSELIVDMNGKKLASDVVGSDAPVVPSDQLGTIFMWIPRFAINSETNDVKYIKDVQESEEGWTIPDLFTYKQELETVPDFSLTGIWLEKDVDTSYSSKITQMNQEESIYGFLANNKATQITTDESTALEIYNNGTAGAPFPTIDTTNLNRIILKIINSNNAIPIKAKATYNKNEGKIEIQVTYSKNGITKIIDEEGNILSENSLTADTGNKEIENGTYTFTVIDNENNKQKCTVTVSGIIPPYYGAEVKNYTAGGIKWRIFHKDEEERIYLIADDYVPYTSLPTSTTGTALNKYGDYKISYKDIVENNDYTGSDWIINNTNTNAKKWLNKYLNAHPNSTNENIKAVAYMMDTNAWSSFAGDKAEYTIGGPTIELFCASYKVTHPDKYIECDSVTENGYQIKWSDGSYTNYITGLAQNDFNKIYISSDTTKTNVISLASPSANATCDILWVASDGRMGDAGYYTQSWGFRPIVCLNAGSELQSNEDGTYSIIPPIEANATYDKTEGKIKIEVTYTKNGIAKILDEEGNILSENSLTANTGTKILDKTTYTFTVIDNAGNEQKVTVSGIIPSYYGKEVTNYTAGGIKWRVFHKDDSNIYLIADDYIPYTSIPTSTAGNALNKGSTDYKAHFRNIAGDYTGSAWIRNNTNTNAKKWLNTYLSAYSSSTNGNIKAVAYMMDTNKWNGFVDSTYAEYAIGGPTVELFCASYKVTHPDRYTECNNVTSTGYKVRWSDGSYAISIHGLTKDDFNKIYINSDTTKADGMWLASPSAVHINRVRCTNCYGDLNSMYILDGSLGFRPIVCLKPNIQLVSNGDGTYSLK